VTSLEQQRSRVAKDASASSLDARLCDAENRMQRHSRELRDIKREFEAMKREEIVALATAVVLGCVVGFIVWAGVITAEIAFVLAACGGVLGAFLGSLAFRIYQKHKHEPDD
jgi:Flp pilus assembly protein TadB